MTARRALAPWSVLPRRRRGAHRAVRDGAAVQGQRAGDQPARAVARARDPRRRCACGTARRDAACPWVLFAIGMALFWLGDLYTYSYPLLLGRDVPFPSLGDAVYILVYPALMAGLLMLARRRNPGRDRAGAIDAAILTLGLALPSWVALIAPYLHDDSLTPLAQARLGRLPAGRRPAARRGGPARARRRPPQPAFYLLSSSIVAAADHRLRLRPDDPARQLRPPVLARRRLDRLLPAVGRRRAASVDARAGRPEPGEPRLTPLPPGPAHWRVADRSGDRAVHAVRSGDVDSRSSAPRSRSSRWSSSVWPVSFASRSARWSASAC